MPFTVLIVVPQLNSNAKKPLQQCNGFFVGESGG